MCEKNFFLHFCSSFFFNFCDFILVVFLRGFHLGCLLSLSAEVFFTWFSPRAIFEMVSHVHYFTCLAGARFILTWSTPPPHFYKLVSWIFLHGPLHPHIFTSWYLVNWCSAKAARLSGLGGSCGAQSAAAEKRRRPPGRQKRLCGVGFGPLSSSVSRLV
jgi:hypothetical protein